MQIDRYNHLLVPRDANSGNNPAAAGKDTASSGAGAAGTAVKPQAGVAAPAAVQPTRRPEGVVLNIQWPGGDVANNPDPGVYTNGGKLASRTHPAAPDKQPDFVALAVSAMREYSDEHDRQKVRSTAEAGTTLPPAAQPEVHWSALKGLQQIAAKLNVFA